VKPRARRDGLLVEKVDDELLVYDHARRRLHWLNRTAAMVWGLCDGRTTVATMVTLLRERDAAANEDLVTLAVRRLESSHLLAERSARPLASAPLSRRELLRRVRRDGLGPLEPAVTSITLRTVVHAESWAPCHGAGESCGVAKPPCCPGLTCHFGSQSTGICA